MTVQDNRVFLTALVLALVALIATDTLAQKRRRGVAGGGKQSQLRSQAAGSFQSFGSGIQGRSQGGVTRLTDQQTEQLLRMREEEKLAHDVYVTLGKSTQLPLFENIASAESRHMAALEQIIRRYAPDVQYPTLPFGKFSVLEYQRLYESFVKSGETSLLDAVMVGAKIEEMDIKDLQRLLTQKPSQDIARVFENLMRGSRNHLRAFSGQIAQLGGTYTSEYLSQREFDQIANSESERGPSVGMDKNDNQSGRRGYQQQGKRKRGSANSNRSGRNKG